ncbi:MAG: hypothetical protein KJ670_15365 [Alphaproteobacteria bacterium]|nr:hypothetical protein [Alphaproteobacteria bacterium]MBU4051780.1 hypothetical protein [Alphaproteobacteria bacterium]MBU4090087.1 hypothetical protein [Alphaproteobacteria bacterium]MBU4157320.1 hypothetical protein [Alphaproteobacteria bacterium]
MRSYAFYATMLLAMIVVVKYDLRDTKTHRLRVSTEENKLGYFLLVFLIVCAVLTLFVH